MDHREKMCLAVCEPVSSTCLYYAYRSDTTTCKLCVRNTLELFLPTIGAELEATDIQYGAVQSRISTNLGCNILNYNCTTKWMGGHGGTMRVINFNNSTMTSIQFCRDATYPQFIGFTMYFDGVADPRIGCPSIGIAYDMVNLTNDPLSSLIIYHNFDYIGAIVIETVGGAMHGPFGSYSQSDEVCRFDGDQFERLNLNAGNGLDGIQIEYSSCD